MQGRARPGAAVRRVRRRARRSVVARLLPFGTIFAVGE